MDLTNAQYQTIKAHIAADPVLDGQPSDGDGLVTIADAMNATAVPDWTVWRSDVTVDEMGNAWNGGDIDGMSSLNMQRLQLLLASTTLGSFDMRRADRREGFEEPFGANANGASRVAMRAVWKRLATRLEKLLSTGTGSDADPAITTFEGDITPQQVDIARRS